MSAERVFVGTYPDPESAEVDYDVVKKLQTLASTTLTLVPMIYLERRPHLTLLALS